MTFDRAFAMVTFACCLFAVFVGLYLAFQIAVETYFQIDVNELGPEYKMYVFLGSLAFPAMVIRTFLKTFALMKE